MSKLDELDKELEQEYDREWEDNFRDPFTQSLVFFKDFARRYYELGKLEEREEMKEFIENQISLIKDGNTLSGTEQDVAIKALKMVLSTLNNEK